MLGARERRSAERVFPLPANEAKSLVVAVLVSDAILFAVGVVLAVCATAVRSGNLSWTVVGLGALSELAGSLSAVPGMVVIPLALVAALEALDRVLAPRSGAYRAERAAVRHGINGELPRLPIGVVAVLMIIVGFVEELVFRYGVIGLAVALLGRAAPEAAAIAVALALSTALFAAAHVQYRGRYTIGVVVVLGLLLGLFYVQTRSLLACAVFHALYDFCDALVERWHMVHDRDYFDGDVPVYALADERERAGESRRRNGSARRR